MPTFHRADTLETVRWLASSVPLLLLLTLDGAARAQAEGEPPPLQGGTPDSTPAPLPEPNDPTGQPPGGATGATPATPAPATPPPGYGAPQPYPPPPAYNPAYAQPYGGYEPPPPPPPPPENVRSVSITLSPLHLLFPMGEIMLEFRPVDHLGIALIGGYGEVTFEDLGPDNQDVNADVWELGGQFVYYFSKPFHGLHVGAEMIYINVDAEAASSGSFVSGIAQGAAVGPLVGYKVLTSGGFTFVAQGGFQYFFIRGEGVDEGGTTDTAEAREVILLLNLNLGWSF